jgi:transcriptional regulator with XRE-family HTH domain
MLGERIRKLRKQKKMTLEALAGTELTKGMLSLIENNKANPSMESLNYIAEQLDVEVTELLEEISSLELSRILEQAEKLYNTPFEELKVKYKQLIELIEPHVDHLSQGYEAARLLELYSYSLAHEKKQGWLDTSILAAKKYDQMNITSNRTAIGIFRAMQKFTEYDYKEALEIFLRERKEIELNHAFIDPLTRLNLDYHEAILHFAVGNSDSATRVMETAIHFSNEKRIFYLINDLYRLAAAQAMMSKNEEKLEYYSKKLKQYGEFADHMHSIMFYKFIKVTSLITENKDYSKALLVINELSAQNEMEEFFKPWFSLEKGKALYNLGRYEEALKCHNEIVIPSLYHPFDLSIFYVLDSYKALSHHKLGNMREALTLAKTAVNNFEPLLDTSFKAFSLEVYQELLNHNDE